MRTKVKLHIRTKPINKSSAIVSPARLILPRKEKGVQVGQAQDVFFFQFGLGSLDYVMA